MVLLINCHCPSDHHQVFMFALISLSLDNINPVKFIIKYVLFKMENLFPSLAYFLGISNPKDLP